jgi:hypothetical protein
MIKLSLWEQLVVNMAISLLTLLDSSVTNEVELAALESAQTFLQKLVAGNVSST